MYLGTGTSFNISNIPGYKTFNTNNFIVGSTSFNSTCHNGDSQGRPNLGGNVSCSGTLSKNYNSVTGILTITTGDNSNSADSGRLSIGGSMNNPFAYLVIGTIQ